MISWIKKFFKTEHDTYTSRKANRGELEKLAKLEQILRFKVRSKSIFLKALTHRSYLELHPDIEKSNERLEFLGDAVLNLIVAKLLFQKFPKEEEGNLTKKRAFLVNREKLSEAAEDLKLREVIFYNKKYIGDSVEGMKTILADAFEALVGAIYIEKGIKKAEQFISKWIVDPIDEDSDFFVDTNYKGQLLEYTHARKLDTPRYRVADEQGPEHQKEFTVEVFIGDELVGIGKGNNKKNAEQDASQAALKKLNRL